MRLAREHSRRAATRHAIGEFLKAAFWHDRWKNDQIGFHNDEFNEQLTRHWPTLEIEEAAKVFVPLCGKSLDMHWLHQQGHPVVGVDFSPKAVHAFFSEAGITPSEVSSGAFTRSSSQGFDLYCGDFFDLTKNDLAGVRACYDRGSLIALPPDLRIRYAEHLTRVLPERVTILLVALEYDQSKMNGPPHSVPPSEVEDLFGASFDVEALWSSDWVDAPPRFRERGMETRRDTVMRLDRGGRA
jgi:thiopurine S-methyltransferase